MEIRTDTPPGYAAHLQRMKASGRAPMTPDQWEKVAQEMDEMPGTMDLPATRSPMQEERK